MGDAENPISSLSDDIAILEKEPWEVVDRSPSLSSEEAKKEASPSKVTSSSRSDSLKLSSESGTMSEETVDETYLGMGVAAHNVSVKVKKRLILDRVSFLARPGRVTAIMGPSGCGKTTLMNAISQRTAARYVKGEVKFFETYVNSEGRKRYATRTDMRRFLRFVPAFDANIANLTVHETIMYAARLRLPHFSAADVEARVLQVMDILEITPYKDVMVDIPGIRKGTSTGQTKRLGIAIELLDRPSVLLLDEPTSALDAATAFDLVMCLRRIAQREKMTVALVIHQPRSKVFDMFDDICLMTVNGNVFYQGEREALVDPVTGFLATNGYPCAEEYNPADYLLELLTPEVDEDDFSDSSCEEGAEAASGKKELKREFDRIVLTPLEQNVLIECYKASTMASTVNGQIQNVLKARRSKTKPMNMSTIGTRLSVFWTLIQRQWFSMIRNYWTLSIIVLMAMSSTILLGCYTYPQFDAWKVDIHIGFNSQNVQSLVSDIYTEFQVDGPFDLYRFMTEYDSTSGVSMPFKYISDVLIFGSALDQGISLPLDVLDNGVDVLSASDEIENSMSLVDRFLANTYSRLDHILEAMTNGADNARELYKLDAMGYPIELVSGDDSSESHRLAKNITEQATAVLSGMHKVRSLAEVGKTKEPGDDTLSRLSQLLNPDYLSRLEGALVTYLQVLDYGVRHVDLTGLFQCVQFKYETCYDRHSCETPGDFDWGDEFDSAPTLLQTLPFINSFISGMSSACGEDTITGSIFENADGSKTPLGNLIRLLGYDDTLGGAEFIKSFSTKRVQSPWFAYPCKRTWGDAGQDVVEANPCGLVYDMRSDAFPILGSNKRHMYSNMLGDTRMKFPTCLNRIPDPITQESAQQYCHTFGPTLSKWVDVDSSQTSDFFACDANCWPGNPKQGDVVGITNSAEGQFGQIWNVQSDKANPNFYPTARLPANCIGGGWGIDGGKLLEMNPEFRYQCVYGRDDKALLYSPKVGDEVSCACPTTAPDSAVDAVLNFNKVVGTGQREVKVYPVDLESCPRPVGPYSDNMQCASGGDFGRWQTPAELNSGGIGSLVHLLATGQFMDPGLDVFMSCLLGNGLTPFFDLMTALNIPPLFGPADLHIDGPTIQTGIDMTTDFIFSELVPLPDLIQVDNANCVDFVSTVTDSNIGATLICGQIIPKGEHLEISIKSLKKAILPWILEGLTGNEDMAGLLQDGISILTAFDATSPLVSRKALPMTLPHRTENDGTNKISSIDWSVDPIVTQFPKIVSAFLSDIGISNLEFDGVKTLVSEAINNLVRDGTSTNAEPTNLINIKLTRQLAMQLSELVFGSLKGKVCPADANVRSLKSKSGPVLAAGRRLQQSRSKYSMKSEDSVMRLIYAVVDAIEKDSVVVPRGTSLEEVDRIRTERELIRFENGENDYKGTKAGDKVVGAATAILESILGVVLGAAAMFVFFGMIGFANIVSMVEFFDSRRIMNRERANNLYGTLSWYLAKNIVDLPFMVIPFLCGAICFWYIGGYGVHQSIIPGITLARFILAVVIGMVSAGSQLYFVGACCSRVEQGLAFLPTFYLIQFVLCGFFLPDKAMADWYAWMRHLTIFRYPFFGTMCALADRNAGPYGCTIYIRDIVWHVVPNSLWTLVTSTTVFDYGYWMWGGVFLAILYRVLALVCISFFHRNSGLQN